MDRKVKLSLVLEGFDFIDDNTDVYLDLENQTTVCNYLYEDAEEDEEFEIKDTYIKLPTRYEMNEYKWLQEFADSYPDNKISIGLQVAIIGQGAFQRFNVAIKAYQIAPEWYNFKKKKRIEAAKTWCLENNIELINDIE